jgi:SAM-dependent methyltransferase
MVEAARARVGDLANVTWEVKDVGDLDPLPPATFDAALLLGVLPHLPTVKHVAAVIDELGHVLAPGATVVFDVRSAAPPLVLPGEHDLPPHVLGHPLWDGVAVDLETLSALAHQAELTLERIEGSGSARCLVLARRDED